MLNAWADCILPGIGEAQDFLSEHDLGSRLTGKHPARVQALELKDQLDDHNNMKGVCCL